MNCINKRVIVILYLLALISVNCNSPKTQSGAGQNAPAGSPAPTSQSASANSSNSGGVPGPQSKPVKKQPIDENTNDLPPEPVATSDNGTATPAPTDKLTDAQIIEKMKIVPFVPNARSGKIFTGISGTAGFAVPLILDVDGVIPKDIVLTKDDEKRIYESDGFLKKTLPFRDKIVLKVDPAFFTVKETATDATVPERVFFLTAVKAGASVITVSIGTESLTINATTQTYAPAALQAGAARFTTAAGTAPACASCHNGTKGPTHSPTWLAAYTDAAVLSTIETGTNPESMYKLSVPHAFVMANANLKIGMVAYLRSLPPMP